MIFNLDLWPWQLKSMAARRFVFPKYSGFAKYNAHLALRFCSVSPLIHCVSSLLCNYECDTMLSQMSGKDTMPLLLCITDVEHRCETSLKWPWRWLGVHVVRHGLCNCNTGREHGVSVCSAAMWPSISTKFRPIPHSTEYRNGHSLEIGQFTRLTNTCISTYAGYSVVLCHFTDLNSFVLIVHFYSASA